jgi:hypothetical protein
VHDDERGGGLHAGTSVERALIVHNLASATALMFS